MDELNSDQTLPQIIEKPMAIMVFGVLNIVFGCYFLVRIGHSWYRIISGILQKPERITWSEIPFFLLLVVSTGLVVWLIVLGIGLLKMKRWARRGSVIYAWIQIVFIVITLGATVVSLVIDWKDSPRIIWASINTNNGLALIHGVYMVSLLIFMKTAKVKRAFAAIGG